MCRAHDVLKKSKSNLNLISDKSNKLLLTNLFKLKSNNSF